MPYARKTGSKRKSTTKAARAVVKASKYLMLKSVETKHHVANVGTNLVSESIYTYSPTQQVLVGNTSGTRIGDAILLQSLILSGQWVCASAALNVKFRIIVGWSRNQAANASMAPATLGAAEFFYQGSTGPMVNRVVNPYQFTTLYDEIVDINSNTSTGSDIKSFYSVIGLGMKNFKYANTGGSFGQACNLVVGVFPYIAVGATGTACGKVDMQSVLKFKDP